MVRKSRLERLEKAAAGRFDKLFLPDGTEGTYRGEDALAALLACIDEENHWLLPPLRQAGKEYELPDLIQALEAPQKEDLSDEVDCRG